jgi:hypothetical protein
MFEKISYRFQTAKLFFRRNNTAFACVALIFGMHVVWWQVQQNKNLVSRDQRIRHIGPIRVPYLDESDYYQNKLKEARKAEADSSK